MAAGTSSDGNVRVHWVEKDNLVAATFGSRTSNATAAIARSGYPIAEKLVARMKREVRGKVVNHWTEAIYLAGLPDVPESRPHSGVNSRRFRQ